MSLSNVHVHVGPNIRVTYDNDPHLDRSESALAVNPLDSGTMIGASKRFINPLTYDFTLAAYATTDGGQSWSEAPPLTLPRPSGGAPVAGLSDPAVACDNRGGAYLIALLFSPGFDSPSVGIVVYQSHDGGRTWAPPNLIHESTGDDRPAMVGDVNPASRFSGNVYAAWDDARQGAAHLRFARTTDSGGTWKGMGATSINATSLTDGAFAPAMAVSADGTLYITWITGDRITFVKSTDGGESFTKSSDGDESAIGPDVIASGIGQLRAGGLPVLNGFPELPGGTFRVGTYPAIAAGAGGTLVVAWTDYREGVSRIYYRRSRDGGTSWEGPASGQPLLTGGTVSAADQHDFHAQLATTPNGEIGCAFYEFGPKGGRQLIDVILAVSVDDGLSFSERVTVTDSPWDPAVDAPRVHGDPATTFIGDYFGLAASDRGFFPFWTDTRTGMQEIFTADVVVRPAVASARPRELPRSPHPATILNVSGTDFSPDNWVSIEVRSGDTNGPLVAKGGARTDGRGHFLFATNKANGGGVLTVQATDMASATESNVATIQIRCSPP